MSYSTNVPQPTLGPNGFIAPTEQAILTGVQADYTSAFGTLLNPALNTPQGQLETSTTAIINDANNQFVFLSNMMDPAYNFGRWQDAIGRIYFLTRNPAEPTALQVACGGLQNAVIPVGALVADANDNLYACLVAGTIGVTGTVTLGFANQVTGPVAVPNAVRIYQAVPGWNTSTLVSGVAGTLVESRAAFEARRQATVAANGQGFLDAIAGAVYEVPGVLSVYAVENPTGGTVSIGGVSLVAHSLYIAAYGGSSTAIAQAIWAKKDPGCDMNGNTTVTVYDTNPSYSPPYPSYLITFEIPRAKATCFNVTLKNSPQIPSNAATLIQAAVLSVFNGDDGGLRAGIGATIYASRYYSAIASLGSWVQIETIQVGTNATPGATFTGTISTTTLTVSAVASGTLAIGQFVFGANVSSGSIIQSQLTGTPGGVGTYALAVASTVGTGEAMATVAASSNFVSLNIDQMPTLQSADVNLILA